VALLYDANGCEIRDGVTQDDVVAAIQAAAIAGEWSTAQDIADRHGLTGVCLKCAIKAATTAYYATYVTPIGLTINNPWRVCITCYHALTSGEGQTAASFASMKIYTQGLIKRNVQ
jgi:hypothetical protein